MIKFTLRGAATMARKIREIATQFPNRVERALYTEAQVEMTEAKRRVPVDTGALRGSGIVHEPEREGSRVSVTLSFGGAAVEYAIYVHENLDAFHKVGQAKYLESVLNESAPFMAERLARRIHLENGG